MPGVLLAIAIVATLAFASTHAAVASQRRHLPAGTRWDIYGQLGSTIDPTTFDQVFPRTVEKGAAMYVEGFTWISLPREIKITVRILQPTTIDIGMPLAGLLVTDIRPA